MAGLKPKKSMETAKDLEIEELFPLRMIHSARSRVSSTLLALCRL